MKEWYLIGNNTKPNMIGGYENQSFLDYKDDSFDEALTTDISDTVMIYNYDLSESKEIRGIIQGNTADTDTKSMERSILVPIGTLHSGDYIFFENEFWIVNGRPGNNKIYEKATLKECQYKLRWQKQNGIIIERWANLTSTTKDIGITGDNTIIVGSGSLSVIIPHDADSMTIENKRVFIDTSHIPTKVYKITRNDDALNIHGNHGGTLNLIADKTELNMNTDNQEIGICDYIDISDQSTSLSPPNPNETVSIVATISGNRNLKCGYSRTYTATFTDLNGNDIVWNDIDFAWNIESDFDIMKVIDGNKITISINNNTLLVGQSLTLQILVNSIIIAKTKIVIVEGW